MYIYIQKKKKKILPYLLLHLHSKKKKKKLLPYLLLHLHSKKKKKKKDYPFKLILHLL